MIQAGFIDDIAVLPKEYDGFWIESFAGFTKNNKSLCSLHWSIVVD